ncbi:hypothetical protein C8R43DRAFT_1044501 [Mycena crocata]|nr:hypothetical protein C8R43DRAFT_1044501 [Mycena crocata]
MWSFSPPLYPLLLLPSLRFSSENVRVVRVAHLCCARLVPYGPLCKLHSASPRSNIWQAARALVLRFVVGARSCENAAAWVGSAGGRLHHDTERRTSCINQGSGPPRGVLPVAENTGPRMCFLSLACCYRAGRPHF